MLLVTAHPREPIALEFETLGSIEGTDKWDWWQARTAFVPGDDPLWLTTMSETGKGVSHDFHDVYQSLSRDGGRTWSKPMLIKSLQRVKEADGFEISPGDLWPTWHAKSGMVLTTGKTFNFAKGAEEKRLREKVSYAVADPRSKTWGEMKFLAMPEKDHSGRKITACNAGNHQRVDLPNGEILLPVRYVADVQKHNYTSTVARCRFDGETLTYLEHGTELNIHVLRLGDENSSTKLKLMQVAGKKPTRIVKQPYIHSTAGFSYLTIFVKNVEKIISRAKKYGYQPYAQSPQVLPEGLPQDICLLMLKDPDGNFVEIVGPLTKTLEKKQ